ncbi:AlbA family DNA-binding domain-containing protein [Algoriphagus boritolerans]|uniref:Putative DNA-binding domain-containing protein n=1 Tax=Algoriphagus boritolerans DSM 17298 = JCM 18970 TaxID=1120964 RepID=A0A1H5TMX4_9BACT|nr:ATP-binding protein [Algoriphagus boritolerans]SEF64119.1 Putative DNA-binding domain-containing protein [Algoriphagus boritolerans DSM 17298 = JCM 18970]
MKSAKFDNEFIKTLLKEKEGLNLDFKQKITSKEKIAKTLSAFANSEGGFLVIGMSDNKNITGIDPEEERYMIESANEDFCVPGVKLIFDEVKVSDDEGPVSENSKEKILLLVKVLKSQGTLIYCKNKAGELKAYRRFNNQSLAI